MNVVASEDTATDRCQTCRALASRRLARWKIDHAKVEGPLTIMHMQPSIGELHEKLTEARREIEALQAERARLSQRLEETAS
jgi:hypothetical protein